VAITQESTYQELLENTGYMLGNVFSKITAAANGTTTTILIDTSPNASADDFNGRFIRFTSGANNDELTRQTTDTTVTSNRATITFYPAISDATATNDTAELWESPYDPARTLNLFNQAVKNVTGHIFDPVEDVSLHSGGKTRFDIPTTFEMVSSIYQRTRMDSLQIVEGGNVWSESIDSDFAVTQDNNDKIFGKVATKFVVGSGVSAGDIATVAIGASDLGSFTHIEFPIKVRDAVASDDLRIRLSSTANGAATTEEIIIPAIAAITDTWVRVSMTAPSAASAIISVALEYNANHGDNIIWIGKIEATNNDSYDWSLVPRNLWYVDKSSRDLVLTPAGKDHVGWSLLKLVGGDNPAQFTSDASITEIPERYLIHYVVGHLQNRVIKGEDGEQARIRLGQASAYLNIADAAKRNFPILSNIRATT